jgi:IgGFc binding protein
MVGRARIPVFLATSSFVTLLLLAACFPDFEVGVAHFDDGSAPMDAKPETPGMDHPPPLDVASDLTTEEGALYDGPTGSGCTPDLQSIENDAGKVIGTCPPDQGCMGGKCVPACEAAAAGKGTIGCDFLVATPSFLPDDAPPCFAIFIANDWGKPVTIAVSRAGTSYDPTTFGLIPVAGQTEASWLPIASSGVPDGKVAILFMSQDPTSENGSTRLTCPISPAINQTSGTAVYTGVEAATGHGDAWHIVTDVPVTAYDILPYGGADSFLPSAELLIPTTAWTTSYSAVVPYRGNADTTNPGEGPQWGQVVASKDGTLVTVVPNVALPSGTGVASAPAGTSTTYKLSAGEYIQWQDSTEMSGTLISSNHPIGFSGGLGLDCYSSVTSIGGGCDSAHQQIPPLTALGSDYVVSPYTTRMVSLDPESIPYRIVGVADGTTLTYDPPGFMSTAGSAFSPPPTTLSAGQVVEFETTLGFEVKSQDDDHPFYVGQMMTGCDVTGGSRPGCTDSTSCCLGDEEFVNILPPAQFLQKYVFFTDVTYATTNLVLTRKKTAAGFQDVTLDCAGKLTGWLPIGTSGTYETTNIDLVRAATQNGTCNNGPHSASSPGPFGLMVWGLDSFSSYAYPAGGYVGLINKVTVPGSE